MTLDPRTLNFKVMNEYMAAAEALYQEVLTRRTPPGTSEAREAGRQKRKKLREVDPW